MSIEWRSLTLDDEELIKSYYKMEQSRSCEYTFANNILWTPHYKVLFAIVEGALVFHSSGERVSVSFPIGKKHIKEAVEALAVYFKEKGKPFCMHLVTPEQFQILEELYPGKFQIEYDRDSADYIYETEKLISLSGKKLHSKRNHINKFLQEHENWNYEPITDENSEECIAMAHEWCRQNGCKDDPDKSAEICVTINSLKMRKRLELIGGILRLDGRIVAFTLGEECCEDTFVVHVEKAFPDIQGAYPMINQQFAEHAAAGYRYINREEDTGAEGLRKAKLSYYPVFLQEKGFVTLV